MPGGGFVRIVGDGESEVQLYDLIVQVVPEPSGAGGAAAALLTLAALNARRRIR